jgi:hypothetical protein
MKCENEWQVPNLKRALTVYRQVGTIAQTSHSIDNPFV